MFFDEEEEEEEEVKIETISFAAEQFSHCLRVRSTERSIFNVRFLASNISPTHWKTGRRVSRTKFSLVNK